MKYLVLLLLSCIIYAADTYTDSWTKNQIAKDTVFNKIKVLEKDLEAINQQIVNVSTHIQNVEVLKTQILKYSNMKKEDEYAIKLWKAVYDVIIKDEQRLTKISVDFYFKQVDMEPKLEK